MRSMCGGDAPRPSSLAVRVPGQRGPTRSTKPRKLHSFPRSVAFHIATGLPGGKLDCLSGARCCACWKQLQH
jgi:hypothetical protein